MRIISNTSLSIDEISLFRIFIGVLLLVNPPTYSWLSEVPPGFFKPNVLTFANLFTQLPPDIYFKISDIFIIFLIILGILGIKSRIAFLLLFVITIINNSFMFSFGKIDHSVFSSLIFLLLFFTNSGVKYALVPDKIFKSQNLATASFAIALVFAFFTAGIEKLPVWVDFDLSTSGIFSWFYPGYLENDRNRLLADYFFYTPFWLTEIMDYTAVLFEITGLFFLFYSRKTWYGYLIFAVIFHLTNTLFLNIPFTSNLVVYSLWLLSPLLKNNKWILLLPLFFLVIEDLLAATMLWSIIILLSIYGWKNYYYRSAH